MTVQSVTFTDLSIWVQIWGLPFDLMNAKVSLEIGNSLGQVVEVDCKALTTDQVRFLRVRVVTSLDKPIRRGGPIGTLREIRPGSHFNMSGYVGCVSSVVKSVMRLRNAMSKLPKGKNYPIGIG